MLNVSHSLSQFGSALLVFSIPASVFWPYFAGAAILVIGLATSIKNRIGQASGLDKFILFSPLCFAIAMAIFGADHLFWAYFVGFALLAAALSLGYNDPVALGCGIARNYDFYFRSDDSHPQPSRHSARQSLPHPFPARSHSQRRRAGLGRIAERHCTSVPHRFSILRTEIDYGCSLRHRDFHRPMVSSTFPISPLLLAFLRMDLPP